MTYPGGKGSTFRHVINHIPPHTTYIEPFAGAAQVMAHKRPARINIAVDLDPEALRLAWARGLHRMHPTERAALLDALGRSTPEG